MQVCLAAKHDRSTVEEMDLWQTVVKTSGQAVGKRLPIRPLYPEVTYCSLPTSDETQVAFREPSLLPGREPLGVLFFSVKYDEAKEQLALFLEVVNDFAVQSGRFYIEAYLWDLSRNIRKRVRSATVRSDGLLLEFKETLRFKNMHAAFYESHHLCVRLMRKAALLGRSRPVGQAVLKLEKLG